MKSAKNRMASHEKARLRECETSVTELLFAAEDHEYMLGRSAKMWLPGDRRTETLLGAVEFSFDAIMTKVDEHLVHAKRLGRPGGLLRQLANADETMKVVVDQTWNQLFGWNSAQTQKGRIK